MKQHRNTLGTQKVLLNSKMYFLDLKEAKNGSTYMVITQSKPLDDDKYERIKMILFEEEIQKFKDALNELTKDFTPSEQSKQKRKVSEAYIAKIRQTHPMAFHPWSKENEELLIALFNDGKSVADLSKSLQRQEGAITARLEKLGLIHTASAA